MPTTINAVNNTYHTFLAYAQSNTTQSSSGTLNFSSLMFAGAGGVSVGVSNGSVVVSGGAAGTINQTGPNIGVSNLGNTAGSTQTVSTGNVVFAGVGGVTLSQSTGAANSNATISISVRGVDTISSFMPYWPVSTGVQSLASASGQSSSGSLFLWPFSVPGLLNFSRVDMDLQLSYVTSATAAGYTNTYKVHYGIFSMNANTALSLISSSSFSILESLSSVSLTWNFPTSTATTGYGYGSFAAGNLTTTAQISSFVSGHRQIGMQFGNTMSLTPGNYWYGIFSGRTTAGNSTAGLSVVGAMGNIMPAFLLNGTSASTVGAGMQPMGIANSQWTTAKANVSDWRGRPVMGVMTATSITNFGGTIMPPAVTLTAIGGVAASQTVSIMPFLTFAG